MLHLVNSTQAMLLNYFTYVQEGLKTSDVVNTLQSQFWDSLGKHNAYLKSNIWTEEFHFDGVNIWGLSSICDWLFPNQSQTLCGSLTFTSDVSMKFYDVNIRRSFRCS